MIKNNINICIDGNLEIIYEDNHLIAVNKRPADLSQPDKTGDVALDSHLKNYLKKKYDKPGDVFCVPCHRIDRPVSGTLVFARTSKALMRMSNIFKERKVRKTYWAVCETAPLSKSGTLINYLKKNTDKNKSYVVSEQSEGAKRAELSYKFLGASKSFYLLEVEPKTGRHHQIRVQLSHMGCVIKGDVKYGAKRTNEDASIHLHAREIEFEHPVRKEQVVITANPPDDVVWNFFLKQQNA